jgi:hypothetical protein
MNALEVEARKAALLAEERNEPPISWWMSFCDPDKPKGEQFLGVVITKAPGLMHARQRAWMFGINPGGEIQAFPVEGIADDYHDRLLSLVELEAAGLI